jgi:uncharacterized membrane protein YgcG
VAWAGAEGISLSDIRPFLRSLTAVVLRTDTAVTNHDFRNGKANAFQSVLQAGTAVLVDEHGVPRVRCACGNPLVGPTARHNVRYTGQTWPELSHRPVTVIQRSTVIIQHFIIVVVQQNTTVVLDRVRGTDGDHDKAAAPAEAAAAREFSVDDPARAGTSNGTSPGGQDRGRFGSTPSSTPSSPSRSMSSAGPSSSGGGSGLSPRRAPPVSPPSPQLGGTGSPPSPQLGGTESPSP